MRKFLLTALALVATAGLTMAAQVKFVKYDEKTQEVTVKAGKKGEEKESTIKLTKDIKFYDGDKEIDLDEAVKKLTGDKPAKGFDVKHAEGDKDKVETIKFSAKKKKDKE